MTGTDQRGVFDRGEEYQIENGKGHPRRKSTKNGKRLGDEWESRSDLKGGAGPGRHGLGISKSWAILKAKGYCWKWPSYIVQGKS